MRIGFVPTVALALLASSLSWAQPGATVIEGRKPQRGSHTVQVTAEKPGSNIKPPKKRIRDAEQMQKLRKALKTRSSKNKNAPQDGVTVKDVSGPQGTKIRVLKHVKRGN